MKNPLTPAGIEPATFRFVAQHLNHCATAVPNLLEVLVVFLATCFGSQTHPSSGSSSGWFVCTMYKTSTKMALYMSRNMQLEVQLVKVKVMQSHYRPGVAQRVPGSQGSKKIVTTAQGGDRLSALRTDRLYPPGNAPGTHFCQGLSRSQGHSAFGRILCQ